MEDVWEAVMSITQLLFHSDYLSMIDSEELNDCLAVLDIVWLVLIAVQEKLV